MSVEIYFQIENSVEVLEPTLQNPVQSLIFIFPEFSITPTPSMGTALIPTHQKNISQHGPIQVEIFSRNGPLPSEPLLLDL